MSFEALANLAQPDDTSYSRRIVGVDCPRGRAQLYGRVDTPAACTLFGMVNASLLRTLAIGERIGKAGPDLFRSPMKRYSHARLPQC
jgi:hypothetical protein